jgi:hypothetical protein
VLIHARSYTEHFVLTKSSHSSSSYYYSHLQTESQSGWVTCPRSDWFERLWIGDCFLLFSTLYSNLLYLCPRRIQGSTTTGLLCPLASPWMRSVGDASRRVARGNKWRSRHFSTHLNLSTRPPIGKDCVPLPKGTVLIGKPFGTAAALFLPVPPEA